MRESPLICIDSTLTDFQRWTMKVGAGVDDRRAQGRGHSTELWGPAAREAGAANTNTKPSQIQTLTQMEVLSLYDPGSLHTHEFLSKFPEFEDQDEMRKVCRIFDLNNHDVCLDHDKFGIREAAVYNGIPRLYYFMFVFSQACE